MYCEDLVAFFEQCNCFAFFDELLKLFRFLFFFRTKCNSCSSFLMEIDFYAHLDFGGARNVIFMG